MVEFLINYYWIIVVVFLCIIALTLYYNGKKKEAFKLIAVMITVAEDIIMLDKGIEKHRYVVDKVYPILPQILKQTISKEKFSAYVESIFLRSDLFLKKSD